MDDFGDEEPTVIDGTPLVDDENITPVELPRCGACGTVVFFDDFTEPAAALAAGLFGNERCIRGRSGLWFWCAQAKGEGWRGEYVWRKPL